MTVNKGVDKTFLYDIVVDYGLSYTWFAYVWLYEYIGLPSMPKREIVESKILYHYFVNDVKLANYWWDNIKPTTC